MKGVSLLELVLSIFILGLVVIFLFNLYPTSILAVRQAEQQLLANTLARSLIAERQARSYDALVVGDHQQLAPITREGVVFHPVLEVYPIAGKDPNLVKRLRVTLTWGDPADPKEVSHETLVSGLQR